MKGVSGGARKTFEENLRRIMQERGISQADIVAKLGVTASTVSDWVNGKKYPRVDTMQRIADAIGVEMDDLRSDRPRTDNFSPAGPFVPVRVAGTVKAGYNGIAFEDFSGYEFADVRHPENYVYFRVEGDSMAPAINDGDLALVRVQPDVESGQVAIVVVNGEEGTIKKVIRRGGSIALQPFNPAYETRVFTGAETDEVCIAGLVVETKRKWA
jgi:repressor LexA